MERPERPVIICQNCGGQYDAAEPVCPYCGTENVKVSIREQLDYLEDIDRKEQALEDLPQQTSRRVNRGITKMALIAGIVIVLGLAIVAVVASNSLKNSKNNQDAHLAQLEKWYQANEYEPMERYLQENELYSATYDKYYKLAQIYRDISQGGEYMKQDRAQIRNNGGSPKDESLVNLIQYGIRDEFTGLSLLREMEEKGFVYNEEEGVEYLRSKATGLLKKYCGLTDEEIQAGIERYEGYETDYREEAIRMIQEAKQ